MGEHPLISVIIPVYNSEGTINRAVYSVLGQKTTIDIELILVDDGSTDGSAKILDDLSDSHNNVAVIHKANGGVSSARNAGIDHARGKYLAFLDSDDWWENGILSEYLESALSAPKSSDLFAFSYQEVCPSKKWERVLRVKDGVYVYESPSLSHIVDQHHCAFLYKRSFLNENSFRYLPTRVWEDVPFSQICCTFAKSITCIDRILFSYYMNYNSCMHTKTSVAKFREHYKAERYANDIYRSRGVAYELDRTIVSLIGECLKDISAENTYGFVKKLIAGEEFDLLNNSDVQPWKYLQKDVQLWRNNPKLAFLKFKIKGIPKIIKNALMPCRFTRPLIEFVQYRLIEKWNSA